MRTIDCEQGTDAWIKSRVGLLTASRINAIMSKPKAGSTQSKTRSTYLEQLVNERLTGRPVVNFTKTDAMQHGNTFEPHARRAYEALRCVEVKQVGLVLHPVIENAGASPDGLVGEDGLIEIKCPNQSTHVKYSKENRVPLCYVNQVQWQLACCERSWTDFVSYDPQLPGSDGLFIVRTYPDPSVINAIEVAAREFLAEVDEAVRGLGKRKAFGFVNAFGFALVK